MRYGDDEARAARSEFPALERGQIFLDGPAGTQVPRAVIRAIGDYYETSNANTHGAFATSAETDAMIDSVRQAAADFLGAPGPRTISFGQNMTTLAFSLSRALARTWSRGDEVVITELDHEANRGPWRALEERGIVIREAAMTDGGEIDRADLESKVGPRTKLVAAGLASNALGTVNDARWLREVSQAHDALLLLDAVHYAAHFPIDVTALETDFLLCSAYKFYGPHVGILYAREGLLDDLPTDRLITQEQAAPWRIETGTLNHAAIAGVGAALEFIAGHGEGVSRRERLADARDAISSWESSLAKRYSSGLSSIGRARIWGPPVDGRRAPTISITIDGVRSDEVAAALARRGIAVWDGDFYARRVVERLGLSDHGGLVRVGFAMYNIPEEVDALLEGLGEIAGR